MRGRGWRAGAVVMGAVAFAGCVTPARPLEDGVFTSGGLASDRTFQCSQAIVASMGYSLNWFDAGEQTLRAERRSTDGGPDAWRGYLTVSVSKEGGPGGYLYVRAERFTEASRLPMASNPAPAPRPQPTPVPRAGASRASKRVSPGPIASDALEVVRRCARGGEGHLASW